MAKTDAEKALDKLTRFRVNVTKHEFVKSEKVTKYSKLQRSLTKLIGVKEADNYNWCYRVQYKSNRGSLKPNDVILNNEGRGFFVLKEMNRVALIITTQPSTEKPFVHGNFRVIDKQKLK